MSPSAHWPSLSQSPSHSPNGDRGGLATNLIGIPDTPRRSKRAARHNVNEDIDALRRRRLYALEEGEEARRRSMILGAMSTQNQSDASLVVSC